MTGFTKSLKNKLLAVFIAVFALCAGAIAVFAATGAYNAVYAEEEELLTITVSQETADTENVAEVNISLKNYSRLVACKIQVFYEGEIEFVVGKFNEEIEKLKITNTIIKGDNVVTLSFMSGEDNIILGKGDVLATLSFKMSKNGEENLFCPITVECNKDDVLDENRNPINFDVVSGGVLFTNSVAGDVNGDGYFDMRDVLLLFYCINDEEKYSAKVVTKDINGDGHFDMRDVLQLFQYQFGKSGVPKPHIPMVFKVTFDGNGGTLVSGEETQKVKENKSATAPEYIREGYKFTGFDKQEEMSCVTKTMTVKAQWEELVTHEHTYSEEWSSDGAFHWHAATCEHTTEVSDKSEHEFNDIFVCIQCGYIDTTGQSEHTWGFDNTFVANNIGRSINMITAKSFEPAAGTQYIFDTQKLFAQKVIKTPIPKGETKLSMGTSYEAFLEDFNLNLSVRIGKNEKGEQTDSGINYMPGSCDFSVNLGGSYKKVTEEETTEFYYQLKQIHSGYMLELYGYAKPQNYAAILSDSFKRDARAVNNGEMSPAAFIDIYGTHVMMGAYYGSAVNVNFYSIEHKDSTKEQWDVSLETDITNRLFFSDFNVGVNAKVGDCKTEKNESKNSVFTVSSIGGENGIVAGIDDISDFNKNYQEWSNSVSEDKYGLLDVPDGSLFCVWDYLDESYSTAKNKLNQYAKEKCGEYFKSLTDKVSKTKMPNHLKYDEATGALTVTLANFQKNGNMNEFNNSLFDKETNVLTLNPVYQGKEVKIIVFDGGYYVPDDNGNPVQRKIENFAVKFGTGWNKDFNIILNNVAFSAPSNTACFDFSDILNKNIKVNINYNGKNYLEGGGGTAAQGVFNADGIDLGIIGSTGAELIVHGGAGASVEVNKSEPVIVYGSNGADGATAIIAKSLTINTFGTLKVYGGDGEDGKAGKAGEAGKHDGRDKNDGLEAGSGSRGGNGGNGGHSIVVEEVVVQNAKILLLQGGIGRDGGNGGAGGRGGNGKGERGACGGKGGDGGDGGNGGNGGSIIANYITIYDGVQSSAINIVIGQSGAGGKGGNGGQGGTPAKNTSLWAKGGKPADGGNGGNGGNGGTADISFKSILPKEITEMIDFDGIIGRAGFGGLGGLESDLSGDSDGDDGTAQAGTCGLNGTGIFSNAERYEVFNGYKRNAEGVIENSGGKDTTDKVLGNDKLNTSIRQYKFLSEEECAYLLNLGYTKVKLKIMIYIKEIDDCNQRIIIKGSDTNENFYDELKGTDGYHKDGWKDYPVEIEVQLENISENLCLEIQSEGDFARDFYIGAIHAEVYAEA